MIPDPAAPKSFRPYMLPRDRGYRAPPVPEASVEAIPRRKAFRPGDLVYIRLENTSSCAEFNGRQGVVVFGPDSDGGWQVSSAPGTMRCTAVELIMITPREER